MVFKLAQAAEKSWRRLDGHSQLPKLITGVKFIDGIEAVSQPPLTAYRPSPTFRNSSHISAAYSMREAMPWLDEAGPRKEPEARKPF